jgi:hypothetical protein
LGGRSVFDKWARSDSGSRDTGEVARGTLSRSERTREVVRERLHEEAGRGWARREARGRSARIARKCSSRRGSGRGWQKCVRSEEFTFSGDPMRIDYRYRRNGTRGFVQTLSVSRAQGEVKSLAHTVERIRNKVAAGKFTAVTDVHLVAENERHQFVRETLA